MERKVRFKIVVEIIKHNNEAMVGVGYYAWKINRKSIKFIAKIKAKVDEDAAFIKKSTKKGYEKNKE